jgi:hypothetical protein
MLTPEKHEGTFPVCGGISKAQKSSETAVASESILGATPKVQQDENEVKTVAR